MLFEDLDKSKDQYTTKRKYKGKEEESALNPSKQERRAMIKFLPLFELWAIADEIHDSR
jgi:hypothetical protein